jgi:hypothetical protein
MVEIKIIMNKNKDIIIKLINNNGSYLKNH